MQDIKLSQREKSFMDKLGRLSARNAASSLSQLLNRKVNVKFSDLRFLPIEDIQYMLGDPGIVVAGVYHELQKDLEGSLVTFMDLDLAKEQLSYMLKTEVDNDVLLTQKGESTLGELSNILCGSYISTICNLLDMVVIPLTPHVRIEMVGAITQDIILKLKLGTIYSLTTKTDLLIGNNVVNLHILLLLEHDSFETLMKKINQKIK
jgi:chemotaxis protein CheC